MGLGEITKSSSLSFFCSERSQNTRSTLVTQILRVAAEPSSVVLLLLKYSGVSTVYSRATGDAE